MLIFSREAVLKILILPRSLLLFSSFSSCSLNTRSTAWSDIFPRSEHRISGLLFRFIIICEGRLSLPVLLLYLFSLEISRPSLSLSCANGTN